MKTDANKTGITPEPRSGSLDAVVRCWCRACKQDKSESEMFAGIVHPDGIGRGICLECHRTGKDIERWLALDKTPAPNGLHERPGANT